jgi:osmotically inducible lipoprotein OsmB
VATSNAATFEGVTACLEKFAMKLNTRFYAATSAVLLVASLALGGCSGMTRQEKSTATGAVIGGVAGNVLCGGIACTAAGAAVGGVVGHEVAK